MPGIMAVSEDKTLLSGVGKSHQDETLCSHIFQVPASPLQLRTVVYSRHENCHGIYIAVLAEGPEVGLECLWVFIVHVFAAEFGVRGEYREAYLSDSRSIRASASFPLEKPFPLVYSRKTGISPPLMTLTNLSRSG